MAADLEPAGARDRSPARRFRVVATLALFAVALAGGVIVGRRLARGPAPGSTVIQSTPSVVVAVRDLSRLEGAEFRIERVISLADKQERLFGLIEAKDAILLVASGAVVAGTDLTGLTEKDVDVDVAKHRAHIELPSSQVLSARLDDEHTFVYSRSTDLLAERKESLESRARQEAERTLEDAARKGGIVQRSNDSVRRTVETLVRSLGFTDVEVIVRGAPAEANAR